MHHGRTKSRAFFVLAPVLALACGDDGPDGTTSVGSTQTGTGTTDASTTSTTGTSTSSGSTSSTSSDSTTTDPSTTSSTGMTSSSTGGDESSTGAADCESIADEGTCESSPDCLWINESCLPAGNQCAGVTMMMQCNFISGCTWNEAEMTCDPI